MRKAKENYYMTIGKEKQTQGNKLVALALPHVRNTILNKI